MKASKLFSAIAVILTLCTMASCNKSEHEYSEYISDNMLCVASINAYDIFTNMGCEVQGGQVTLPAELQKKLTGNIKRDVEQILKVKGIDPKNVIVVLDSLSNEEPVAILTLTSTSDFTSSIKDINFEKSTSQDGFDFYTKDDYTIAVAPGLALASEMEPDILADAMASMRQKAVDKPMADWKDKVINSDNTMGILVDLGALKPYYDDMTSSKLLRDIYDSAEVENGAIVITSELEGLNWTFKGHVADAHGSAINLSLVEKKFDPAMLKYASPVDLFVSISAFPDNDEWKVIVTKYLKQLMPNMNPNVPTLYDNLCGTVMIGFGYKSITDVLEDGTFHFVTAAQVKEGKLQETFDNWCSFIRSTGIPCEVNGQTLKMSLYGYTGYVTVNDGNLVLTTAKDVTTNGDPLIPTSDFGEYSSETIISIPAHNRNITYLDLPFSLNVKITSNTTDGSFVLSMGDTQGQLLQNLITYVSSL